MAVVTRPTGLSDADVAREVAAGHVNVATRSGSRSVRDIIRANVFTRINGLLGVLFVIVMLTGSWINALFGLLVVVNSAVGIVQELRAKHTLDQLALIGEARPSVRREGETREIHLHELVLGDLVEVGPGDQIVVDGRVAEASGLEVDESLLTGESDPIFKDVGDEVMSGSFVVAGAGSYEATRIGADSYAAKVTAEASSFSLAHSELQQGINKIIKAITFLIVPVGIGTVIAQWFLHPGDWRGAVLRAAGAVVPMVPEGLVLLTSVAFAVGVIRLGRRKCLVQELPAIEGLGRVDVVCADKTGTLTEPGLDVSQVRALAIPDAEAREALAQLAAADPRPNASLTAIGEHVGTPSQPWPVVERRAFSSARAWSGADFGPHGRWVMGAPDVVAPGCREASELGETGARVLVLARVDDFEDVGRADAAAMVALQQKIRPDAADTIAYFRDQDVDVKVISGDNARSVAAVTSSLGLPDAEPVDARTLDEATLPDAVEHASVFGRVKPPQKRAMVRALQAQGHTVAMTGDGVNDVLALKDADLGVAMGSGSPAARSVAQIVLLDDSFATLPHVVAEGRRVIGNIERVARLFLVKTVYSAILALAVLVTALPFPFLPIHVTITGWFTIGVPAFILSLAPNNERARPGFVRRVMSFGFPAGFVVACATFVTYLMVHVRGTEVSYQESTATLACLIMVASWVLVVVARPYKVWKVVLVVVSALLYVPIMCWPFTAHLFRLDVSNTAMMTTGLIAGAIGAAVIEALWWISGLFTESPRRLWETKDAD